MGDGLMQLDLDNFKRSFYAEIGGTNEFARFPTGTH
jgi:hypothetical protein